MIRYKNNTNPHTINCATDTRYYWYFTTHGVQPGSIPKGGYLGEVVDCPEGTYFQFSRIITTKELRDYEILERVPPQNLIESSITASSSNNKRHRIEASAENSGSIKTSYECPTFKLSIPTGHVLTLDRKYEIFYDREGNFVASTRRGKEYYMYGNVYDSHDLIQNDEEMIVDTVRYQLELANEKDSIRSSTDLNASIGYVRTMCDNCGHRNRVKVVFPAFNKPFEDTEYECESCGAINELTDPHTYDEDGHIVSSTTSSTISKIQTELLEAVHDMMTSYEFGFSDDDATYYSAVDTFSTNDNMICIEIRAEVDYEGLWALKEVCDPIVQKYYPDAYFDMVTAGIMQAYVPKSISVTAASNDTYYMQLKRTYKNMRKFNDIDSQSGDIRDLEDDLKAHDTPYEIYEHKTDKGCTVFYDDYISGATSNYSYSTEHKLPYYESRKYKGCKYAVHYTIANTDDADEAFDSFEATVREIHPYDDADYYWAKISKGKIKYISNGMVVRINYYFNPEDMLYDDQDKWDIEDWRHTICTEAIKSIHEANKSIKSKMVHN